MDRLRYDLDNLVIEWRRQLHLMSDATEAMRVNRRTKQKCIEDLIDVIRANRIKE